MRDALIVGGGIAGLALACGLARHGAGATILEASADPRPIGAGLQIGPNALRALQALGFSADELTGAVAPRELVVRNAQGLTLLTKPLGPSFEARFGAPYRVMHRGDLWKILRARAESLASIDLRYGAAVERIEPDGAVVLDEGRRFVPSVLIGADGLRSSVRAALLPPRALSAHGLEAWRTLIPAERLGRVDDIVGLTFAPRGGHTVHYPVRGGDALNVVVIAPIHHSGDEGWATPGQPIDLHQAFGAALPPHLAEILAAASRWTRWPLLDRTPTAHWGQGPSSLTGPSTLIGDAAHPALPFLAQGGAMALEDAAALAAPLAEALRSGQGVSETLRRFERARRPRTARLVSASREVGRNYHLPPPLDRARDLGLRMVGRVLTSRYDWIYRG